MYKMLSSIPFSGLSPYVDEIIGNNKCAFVCNWSTTDQIICICHIMENKCEYNGTVHQLFIDFVKAYDSVRGEVLYNIFIAFNIRMNLIGVIKTYS
jgi:hypothetical protein